MKAWRLDEYAESGGIRLISENQPFDHPEEEYDRQYGSEAVDKTIGAFILNAIGFTPKALLEIACGTGHLTASLVLDGRINRIVASDASLDFLRITQRKIASLPKGNDLELLLLSDDDFDVIPQGQFEAIAMRSALHHFADFRATASSLLGKLPEGGVLLMLEPRADFHIAATLLLRTAQAKAQANWSGRHHADSRRFITAAKFYLDNKRNKDGAEDKHVFHIEDLIGMAAENDASLELLGGEYEGTFSQVFHEFMKNCEGFDREVLDDIMAWTDEEMSFMDQAYSGRPRYAAAEWFLLRKH